MRRLLPLLMLAAACEGPGGSPQLDAIARAVVCNVPGAAFDVHGKDLGRAHIELSRKETVVGVAVSEDSFTAPSSHQTDALHVTLDGTNAQPGAYDVSAVSGGGRWTVMRGLALLQPPSVTQESPSGLCDAQSAQTLTISGDGFYTVMGQAPSVSIRDALGTENFSGQATAADCVPAVSSVIDGIQLCNTLTLELPAAQLEPGVHVAVVTNPAPLDCSSTEMKPFLVGPPPSIDPTRSSASLCQGGGTLDLMGQGFAAGATVALGTGAPDSTTVVSDTEITASFSFSPLLVPGQQLSVVVANPDGCRADAAKSVTITPGPVLLAVDPPVVYRPFRTPLVLHVSSVTAPLGKVTLTSQTTGVPVTLSASVDPAHAARVQAEVPPGLGAGAYDLDISDGSGCGSTLRHAVTVVDQAQLALQAVRPAFGDRGAVARITITADSTSPTQMAPGARAFLSAHDGGGSAIIPLFAQLESGALHAVVPAGIPAGRYDVLVVNPDGTLGVLADAAPFHAYQAIDGAPPAVTRLAPEALEPTCGACRVELDGSGFGATPTVGATCYAPGSAAPLASPPPFAVAASPSPSPGRLFVDATAMAALPHGTQCSLYVTNHDAAPAPLGEADRPLSVAVGLSPIGAASTFALAPSLATGRRAPAVAVGEAEPGSRFLYAFGGDGGSLTSGRSDGEVASVGAAGVGSFSTLAGLGTSRTLARAAATGRFLFILGGHDGAASLATVSRAEILSFAQSPGAGDLGVVLDFAQHGLAGGTYYYRVSARFSDSDPLDPGGESLAGPPAVITLPPLAQNRDVTLTWSAGDTNGRTLTGWRLYRGQTPDRLDHALDLPLATTTFTDDDTQFTSSQAPLALGAVGTFTSTGVPQLNTPRAGAAVVAVPGDLPGRWFLYAGFGWNSTGAPALPTSYEVLRVDASDGGTDFGGATHFTQQTIGTQGRWLAGAFSGTPERDSTLSARYVYFGQGTSNLTLTNLSSGDSVAALDGGALDASGLLTPFGVTTPTVATEYGYAAFGGGDSLVMIGGGDDAGQSLATPWRAQLGISAPIPDAWAATAPYLPQAHFLPGCAGFGPYLIVVGGSTGSLGLGSASREVSVGLY